MSDTRYSLLPSPRLTVNEWCGGGSRYNSVLIFHFICSINIAHILLLSHSDCQLMKIVSEYSCLAPKMPQYLKFSFIFLYSKFSSPPCGQCYFMKCWPYFGTVFIQLWLLLMSDNPSQDDLKCKTL